MWNPWGPRGSAHKAPSARSVRVQKLRRERMAPLGTRHLLTAPALRHFFSRPLRIGRFLPSTTYYGKTPLPHLGSILMRSIRKSSFALPALSSFVLSARAPCPSCQMADASLSHRDIIIRTSCAGVNRRSNLVHMGTHRDQLLLPATTYAWPPAQHQRNATHSNARTRPGPPHPVPGNGLSSVTTQMAWAGLVKLATRQQRA